MNLKVEVTVSGDLTRPWHCQQGSIDKGRQGTGFVLLFRCEKVTQTQQQFSEVQRGGTVVCAQLTMQKQGTEYSPPENRSIASSARLRATKEKSRITQFCEKTRREKNEAESRLIGLFGKLNSQRWAANKHGKQWENNEKWVKWNAKYWLRCWFSKGQWNNVTVGGLVTGD